jgi:hypothetical protein
MKMAFDIKEFAVAVVAVIIGAYVLNYLGIVKQNSPMSMGLNKIRSIPARVPTRVIPNVQVVNGSAGHTSVSRGSIGATELSSATSVRPM